MKLAVRTMANAWPVSGMATLDELLLEALPAEAFDRLDAYGKPE